MSGIPVRDRRAKAFKAVVVGESETDGVRPTARKRGVPESTIRRWRSTPEMAQLRAAKREDVQAEVWAAFQLGVKRIIELMPTTEDMNKVAVATGIIYDKFALMSGQATGRLETKDITDTFDDHEREALQRFLQEAIERVEA